MGLFDFVKDIGKSLFGKDASASEAAEQIKTHIQEDNPGVENLEVEFKDGKVVMSGTAASREALEKAVLMAGNAKGVSDVDASAIIAPDEEAKVEYYTIVKGDSLWKIAERFYKKGNEYTRIFEANREVIKDPDLIFPGQKIRIPLD